MFVSLGCVHVVVAIFPCCCCLLLFLLFFGVFSWFLLFWGGLVDVIFCFVCLFDVDCYFLLSLAVLLSSTNLCLCLLFVFTLEFISRGCYCPLFAAC